jgi:hypothetical protein
MSPELAGFVFHRAQRSVYLLEGLRHALADLGRPDLIAVLDLVHQDASQAKEASSRFLEVRASRRALRTLVDLQKLARLGGPHAHPLAIRMARRISA